jgi:hypothetical protein
MIKSEHRYYYYIATEDIYFEDGDRHIAERGDLFEFLISKDKYEVKGFVRCTGSKGNFVSMQLVSEYKCHIPFQEMIKYVKHNKLILFHSSDSSYKKFWKNKE